MKKLNKDIKEFIILNFLILYIIFGPFLPIAIYNLSLQIFNEITSILITIDFILLMTLLVLKIYKKL